MGLVYQADQRFPLYLAFQITDLIVDSLQNAFEAGLVAEQIRKFVALITVVAAMLLLFERYSGVKVS